MAKLDPAELQHRLTRALRVNGNLLTAEGILQAVEEGRMQSWTKNETLGVTELVDHQGGRVLNVVLAVGRLEDVVALKPDIIEFGRQHGAKRIRLEGRRGWDAVLPALGFTKVPNVIYEMEL
jgi:hypothetical protein